MEYKNVIIRIPKYDQENGLKLEWGKKYSIRIKQERGVVILEANEDGLLSLARHLITLASSEVPAHTHIHFDDSNSLENGSSELIIEKLE